MTVNPQITDVTPANPISTEAGTGNLYEAITHAFADAVRNAGAAQQQTFILVSRPA